ncbi:MAG: hypothetical protein KME50_10635 [Nostoc desertorum CM1-VF14]|nr:hypothetical protein [Nostoc desertorum CM1-VF14]
MTQVGSGGVRRLGAGGRGQGAGGREQGAGEAGGAGEVKEENCTLFPMPNAQCPISHSNIYWAQMPTSCVNYLNLSALVFLVQKFHQ